MWVYKPCERLVLYKVVVSSLFGKTITLSEN